MSFDLLKYTPTPYGYRDGCYGITTVENLSDLTHCTAVQHDGEDCVVIKGFTRSADNTISWYTTITERYLPVRNLASFVMNRKAECINIYRPDLIGFLSYEKNRHPAEHSLRTCVYDRDPGTFVFDDNIYLAIYFDDVPSLLDFLTKASDTDKRLFHNLLVRNSGTSDE